ncbi:MAG: DeoR/GlpR transcriptional regulator [Oscillospiraceae bacterium]|nr:DeoR/GlpR transcriptional regulator [Oscillospiraceae bacterium]
MSKQADTVFAEVRLQELLSVINTQGRVRVNDLCKQFNVTPATIRKDLTRLEESGLIRRVHGGAISLAENANLELTSREKVGIHTGKKQDIARRACKYVKPGRVIALDSGTTTMELAKLICNIPDLTVITNDLTIALYLEKNARHTVILLGGTVRTDFHCTVGSAVLQMLDGLHIDTVFLGTNAIDADWGLSTPNMEMANVKSKLIQNSRRVVLLADSSKFGRVSLARFAKLEQVAVLVTDADADPEVLDSLRNMDIEVCTE